jgi:hypothetical protein
VIAQGLIGGVQRPAWHSRGPRHSWPRRNAADAADLDLAPSQGRVRKWMPTWQASPGLGESSGASISTRRSAGAHLTDPRAIFRPMRGQTALSRLRLWP